MNVKEGYSKLKLGDSRLLAAGGGDIAVSELAPSVPGGYLPLSGGTMTGEISNLVVSGANNLAFKIKTGEGIYQNIKYPELSSSVDILLPSSSGTLALTSDITRADVTF